MVDHQFFTWWKRCPVCGARGFRKVKRLGDEIIGWCRRGHPYSAGEEV